MKCDICGKDIGSRIMYIKREDLRKRKIENIEMFICSSCYYKYDNDTYGQIFLSEEDYNKLNSK